MPFILVAVIAVFIGYKAAKMYQRHRVMSKQFTRIPPGVDRSKYEQFYDLSYTDEESDFDGHYNYIPSKYFHLGQVDPSLTQLTWVK